MAGVLAAALLLLGAGEGLSRSLFDAWQRLAPRDLSGSKVHVVAIDDESLKEIGPWPWPRYHLARLTEEIGARGAAAIGFDMIFPERDSLSPDIFSGMYVDRLSAAERTRLASLPSWDNVFGTVIGNHPVVLARIGVDEEGADPDQLASEAVFSGAAPAGAPAYPAAKANIPELDDAARGYGLLNGPPEEDGVVRRVPLVARLGRGLAPGISLEVARVAMNAEEIALGGGRLAVGPRRVPMDGEGRMLLRFGNPAPSATTSAIDLMRKGIPSDALMGKTVLIGLTAKGTPDIVSTPLGAETFGVYVQAQR
jgi:CHASE2 domain-containing sensor protein